MLLENAADDRGEEGALVREVVVDRRLRHGGLAGDVVERCSTHATLAPEPIGGLKHALPRRSFRPSASRHVRDSTYRSVSLNYPAVGSTASGLFDGADGHERP